MEDELAKAISQVYTANTGAQDRHLALTEVFDALVLALPRWVTVAMFKNALRAAVEEYPDMHGG